MDAVTRVKGPEVWLNSEGPKGGEAFALVSCLMRCTGHPSPMERLTKALYHSVVFFEVVPSDPQCIRSVEATSLQIPLIVE